MGRWSPSRPGERKEEVGWLGAYRRASKSLCVNVGALHNTSTLLPRKRKPCMATRRGFRKEEKESFDQALNDLVEVQGGVESGGG